MERMRSVQPLQAGTRLPRPWPRRRAGAPTARGSCSRVTAPRS